jgi:hypothetical protein
MQSDAGKRHFLEVPLTIGKLSGMLLLSLFLLLGSFGALRVVRAQEPGDCPINTSDGIDMHVEGPEGDKAYIVCVDLTNPYIRLETVMAQDVLDVNPRPDPYVRERVESMVNRDPYVDHHPVVAFNADYAGDDTPIHGPEGPTIKNGYRIDGPNSTDDLVNDKSKRVALSVSRQNRIDLNKKTNEELEDEIIHLTRLYNTVGGGPTLVRNGEVIKDPCDPEKGENVTRHTCSDTDQTAVGVSQDGQTFIVVVADKETGQDMGNILRRYGAYSAIKLDGGDSSQLWYRKGDLVKAGGRSIANAVLIFREQIPRHDASTTFQSEHPIVEPGEAVTLTFELWNVGFLTWESDLPYALVHTGGEAFGLETWQPLPASIQPGQNIEWTLRFNAPQEPGAYQTRWQMGYSTRETIEPIGPEIGFIVTVLPEERSPDLAEIIRQMIDQAQQEAEQRLDEFLTDLQERIQKRIEEEIERQARAWLPDCLESLLFGTGIIVSSTFFLSRRKRGG